MIKFIKKLITLTDRQVFFITLVICLALCFSILFIVSPITGLSKNFGAANDGYIQLARSIVAGHGYVFQKGGPPVFHRPPMYPLFLVPIALFPENLQRYIIIIPQSILVGFIGMMIFKIAGKLYNQTIATVAVLLFLMNPWVYWNAKNPMTPILQTFLYLIFAYFIAMELFNKNSSKPLKGLIIGIAGAALAITHAAMLPVVLFFIAVLFVKAVMRDRNKILASAVAGLVVICLIAPWTYRNWLVFHKFIPVSGGGGLAYFNGNVHWSGIESESQKPGEGYINASLRILGIKGSEVNDIHWKGFKDIKYEDLAARKMIEHIRNHPALFMKKIILNAIEYYFPVFTKPFLAIKGVSAEQWALSIFHLVLWIAAVWGVFCCRREGLLLLAGIFIYAVWYFPFATGFIGHSLYTMGTIPFLSILAACGVVHFFRLKPDFFNRPS